MRYQIFHLIRPHNIGYIKFLLLAILIILFSDFVSEAESQILQNPEGMALISGGKFHQGKPGSFKSIYVDPFYMDVTETTQRAFERTMGFNRSFFKGLDRPVENVTWFDAEKFCRKNGKRLPTEWEWEKASRAGSVTKYPWGKNMDDRFAWHRGNADSRTHPVGKKLPNAYGLYDMSGNVWEWTSSDHDGGGKVVRGGSWRNTSASLRSWHGINSLPIHKFHYVGFRCVIPVSIK